MQIVRNVSLTVAGGEIVALIGRNGAGKTTTLSALAGLRHGGWGGSVRLGDADVTRLTAPQLVKRGIALVPEGHRIFRTLTVRENLWLGASPVRRSGKAAISESMTKVFELFPILDEYQSRDAGFLSGGEQQMVAIGQALMARPRVLMLDEPTSGLAPAMIRVIYHALAALRQDGMAILVVEQSVERALVESGRYYVMERGEIVDDGPSAATGNREKVSAIVRGIDRPRIA
jgi:branched-chain amino acid transport system ATP-binding protein